MWPKIVPGKRRCLLVRKEVLRKSDLHLNIRSMHSRPDGEARKMDHVTIITAEGSAQHALESLG